jgi:hypothetical protein
MNVYISRINCKQVKAPCHGADREQKGELTFLTDILKKGIQNYQNSTFFMLECEKRTKKNLPDGLAAGRKIFGRFV